MSIKSARKLGFFMSLTMLVGSVVGIGIFFKSHSILRSTGWNGTGTLIAWLLGGLLSLAAAISFSEMASLKTKNVHGLPAWAEKVGGKKFGYFVRFNYSFFYFGLLTAVLGFFGSEMFFNLVATFNDNFKISDVPMYGHVLFGLFIVMMFSLLNFLSARAGGWVQSVSTVLKWVPLVLVAGAGLILANTNNVPAGNFGKNAFHNGTEFKLTAMLSALPAVLFAFDAFLTVGSMRNKMKNPEKLPMVVLFGMISVVVLYVFVALAAILHGTGMVSALPFDSSGKPLNAVKPEDQGAFGLGIFDQIFSHDTGVLMGKLVVVFLLVSTLGVINGISAAGLATHEQALDSNTIFGFKSFKEKHGLNKTTLLYTGGLLVFWTLVFGIPSMALNSDSIVDGMSNFPTLFFFGVYGTVILLYTLKRSEFETKKFNKYLYKTFAWIAIVGIFFVVNYQLMNGFLIGALENKSETTHWGLFVGDATTKPLVDLPTSSDVKVGVYMSRYQSVFVFFSSLFAFLAFPFANKKLVSKFENRDVVVDTQKA